MLLLWFLAAKLDDGFRDALGPWDWVAVDGGPAMLFLNGECGVTMYRLHSSCIFVSPTKTPISAVAA